MFGAFKMTATLSHPNPIPPTRPQSTTPARPYTNPHPLGPGAHLQRDRVLALLVEAVDVAEPELAQALLAHLEERREPELPVAPRLGAQLRQVRAERARERRRAPPRAVAAALRRDRLLDDGRDLVGEHLQEPVVVLLVGVDVDRVGLVAVCLCWCLVFRCWCVLLLLIVSGC